MQEWSSTLPKAALIKQDSLLVACLTKGRYLSFATVPSLLYTQLTPLSHTNPTWYNIVMTPYVNMVQAWHI